MAEFITFEKVGFTGITTIWNVMDQGGGRLGQVKWYAPWRRYCFSPDPERITVFEQDCLRDLALFVEQMTRDHKKARAERKQA